MRIVNFKVTILPVFSPMSKHRSIDKIASGGAEETEGLSEAFEYPAEGSDPIPAGFDPAERAEIAGALFALVFPSQSIPRGRALPAAFRRFCVLAYLVRPELTLCESVEDLAEALGCTKWAVYKIQTEIMGRWLDHKREEFAE